MDSLKTLLLIDLIILGVNCLVIGLLWRTTKIVHYRKLLMIWLSGVASLFLSVSLQDGTQLKAGLLFSTNFFPFVTFAEFFSFICNYQFSWRKNLLIYSLMLTFSALLLKLQLVNLEIFWFLISLTATFPCLVLGYRAIRWKQQMKSLTIRLGVVNGVLSALTTLTYFLYYDRPDIIQGAYLVALIYVIANTLLLPGIVVEKYKEEQYQLEFELKNRARESYQSKMHSLGLISGSVSHEINNPLFAIQLSLDKFERIRRSEDGNDPRHLELFLDKLKKNISVITGVILNFNKFSGLVTTHEETTDLAAALEGVLIFYREKARKASVELILENQVGSRDIPMNYFELVQVIDILLDNAIEAASGEDPWIKIIVKQHGEKIALDVQNSGPLIEEEVAEGMWKLFYSTKIGRSGTGLSVAKGIVEKNMGQLFLDRTEKVTSFKILI